MGQWQYMLGPKERCRNILGLVYAEDAMKATGRYDDEPHGEDWYADLLSYMASLHVPCAVSPIHMDPYDADDVRQWIERHLDPDTMQVAEEYKDKIPKVGDTHKPHVHILFTWKGAKTRDQMTEEMRGYCEIRETMWQKCQSVDGSLRYFAHLDETDDDKKQRYDPNSVYCFGGLDASALYKNSALDRSETAYNVTMHIMQTGMKHYSQLVRWALHEQNLSVFNCVKGGAPYFAALFKGMADERAEEAAKERAEAEKEANT